MSYKSIDLQTSLPRTAEMSPLAQQQQNKAMAEQAMLAQHGVKDSERQAQRTAKSEQSAKGEISDRKHRDNERQQSKRKRHAGDEEQNRESLSEHPFKGKHIDFTL